MESRIKESIIKHLEYQKSIAKDPEGPFIVVLCLVKIHGPFLK